MSIRTRTNLACVVARVLLVAGLMAWASPSQAAAIVFAQVSNSGSYVAEGNQLAAMLSAAGHTVTTRFLNVAVYNDYASFDQVWVYDLSAAADLGGDQTTNYTNIANWYNGLTNKNLILDGRIISSADNWVAANPGMPQEDAWIQNYAAQLNSRGGGLVLGTDHNAYQSGINNINAGIGVAAFTGFFGGTQAVVDPLSPLYIAGLGVCAANPATRCINDNSTTGFVATGLQTNGQTLTPVAYHGSALDAWDQAAVSATMGSRTFDTCGNPGQPPCDDVPVPEPATLSLVGLGLAAGLFKKYATRAR